MTESLRCLLREIIDYAGLFPPTQLPLEPAIGNFALYREQPENWMLARFICPAARLAELAPLLDGRFSAAAPAPLSVLGRGGANRAAFLDALHDDIRAMSAARAGGLALRLEGFEVRVPPDVLDSADSRSALQLLHETIDLLERAGLGELDCFYEAPYADGAAATLPAAIARLNDAYAAPVRGRAGMKLRTGGVEASAFPSSQAVASTLVACRDANVPLKFTAGLHHPVRHFSDSVRSKMHGFLNVFVAGVLAHATGCAAAELLPLLAEEDSSAFTFEPDCLRWRGTALTSEQVSHARKNFVLSFGSCSFDEPREDLRALKLL